MLLAFPKRSAHFATRVRITWQLANTFQGDFALLFGSERAGLWGMHFRAGRRTAGVARWRPNIGSGGIAKGC
jgi:hypothetical protein